MLIGPRHAPSALPAYLSEMPDKLTLYATDSYFREGWEDVEEVTGGEPRELLGALALIVLKPDAIATRSVGPALAWLERHGFTVLAARRISFSRHSIRATWCYSWNIATRDRKDVVDMMLTVGESLLLLLRGPQGSPGPATRLLSETKGPADPTRRRPGQLRHELGTLNTLLNFLHTADEPADLVRELGIHLPAAERRRLLREALAPPTDARDRVLTVARELEDAMPATALDREAVVGRVRAALAARGADGAQAAELRARLEQIEGRESRDWRGALALIEELGLACSAWDLIGIGTHLVEMDTPSGELLIGSVSAPGAREHS